MIEHIQYIADQLDAAGQASALAGAHAAGAPCQVCLTTSVFLHQLAALLWLWRWSHIGATPHGPHPGAAA